MRLTSSPLHQIPSPLLPVSSLVPVSPPPLPNSPTYPLGYRAAMIRQWAESPSTSHSLPLPPPIILSYTRASVAMMRAIVPSTYILASQSETPPSGTPSLLPIPLPIPSPPLLLPSTDRRADMPEVCLPPRKRLCIALGPRYEDTNEIYRRLDKAQEARAVLSGRLNLLGRDRCSHAYTNLLMEREARISREACGRSMDASDIARSEVRALRTTVLAQ
ncbi:hypothetical protein Tco_1063667 [Tanacetum coccineum]